MVCPALFFFTHYFKTTFLMTWQSQVDDLGQFDDAAMNLAVALTAEDSGATIANHVEVVSLLARALSVVGVVLYWRTRQCKQCRLLGLTD